MTMRAYALAVVFFFLAPVSQGVPQSNSWGWSAPRDNTPDHRDFDRRCSALAEDKLAELCEKMPVSTSTKITWVIRPERIHRQARMLDTSELTDGDIADDLTQPASGKHFGKQIVIVGSGDKQADLRLQDCQLSE